MSVVARLEVIPTREETMSDAVARAVEALDEFDVSYETTPTDTIIEADDPGEVFAAAGAAHRAANADRLVTSLEVDDDRTRTRRGHERVESVERRLGRPAKRERGVQTATRPQNSAGGSTADQPRTTEQSRTDDQPRTTHQSRTDDRSGTTDGPRRYGGPRRSSAAKERRTERQPTPDSNAETATSRYLRRPSPE